MAETDAASEPSVYPAAFERVNGLIHQFATVVGAPLTSLDETGYAELRTGDLRLGLNVDSERGALLVVTTVGRLPENAPAKLLRYLLELNLLATGLASFAVDASSDTVLLRAMCPVASVDFPQFSELLQSIADVATTMRQYLATA